ncbi:MAG TPA: xylulokinase [Verrucomicrobiota bacterium]|nr:xylulokinase [Verrucomicrobiales bacterium]HRI13524.1 xylulokinase [Verrucomicrobiota bacterium]
MANRTLLLGIDSGTQSTKALVVEARTGKVLAEGASKYDLIPDLPPGAKEQHPATWIQATTRAIKTALKAAQASGSEVVALGVSGQQHGFVPLDAAGEVIRPAKLWCDTSTAAECAEITEALGGLKATIKALGNSVVPGFTAGKILWLKKHEPKNFARLATVLLPHDYLNFWLTGERFMEYGDASGTALMDVRKRQWSAAAVQAIDADLAGKLPRLSSSDVPAGKLAPRTAKQLGLAPGILVSAGGGDNMMGAIGTGNTRAGVVTASLGTSGTIYACAEQPVIDPQGEIAAFCDSTNRWLPLLCTMNVTVATEMVRRDFELDHAAFERTAARAPVGSDGLVLVPYLEGERTPNVPDGTGVFFGVRRQTFDAAHFARATMEGVTLGMNYGLRRLAELGVRATQVRATGGGANSKLWRQIMADVFNAEVVTLQVGEGAAYGAAMQALWCWRRTQGEAVGIEEITDAFVKLNARETAVPNAENVARYAELQTLQDELGHGLRPAFSTHRRFVTGGGA